jgi:hypothetical protein
MWRYGCYRVAPLAHHELNFLLGRCQSGQIRACGKFQQGATVMATNGTALPITLISAMMISSPVFVCMAVTPAIWREA